MTKSLESEERLGFGQDILQNLQKYRDFDSFNDQIVQYGVLAVDGSVGDEVELYRPIETNDDSRLLGQQPVGDALQLLAGGNFVNTPRILSADETEQLELVDGRGFPEENGVILIDDEVILYRRREGNLLIGLERGASGTTVLPTFRSNGTYLRTEPAAHYAGSVVVNLSVLFLVAILDAIHKSHAHNIDSSRVVPEINRSSLLQNIRDFFKAKGSKLGIKALFKILFAENDVDVFYPGDRMITPSKSTWDKPLIMRTVPIPDNLCEPGKNHATPDKFINSKIEFKSYSATLQIDSTVNTVFEDHEVFAKTNCEYVSSYPFQGETQYEFFLNDERLQGNIVVNPTSKLTRDVLLGAGIDSDTNNLTRDITTITVNSTLGYPDQGIIFIDGEGIYYQRKTINQFLDCIRGYVGVQMKHFKGTTVYGPYYIEASVTDDDGVEHYSRSWPLGLVESVDIKNPGLLHTLNDEVVPGDPGRVDFREQILCRVNENDQMVTTFLENYNDELARQSNTSPNEIAFIENVTRGVDSLYFDDGYVFVSSNGFPDYSIGTFNTSTGIPQQNKVGPELKTDLHIHVIPRRDIIKLNIIDETEQGRKYVFDEKGTDLIGVFVDGVRAFSNVSPNRLTQGKIVKFKVLKGGFGYVNPTVVITPQNSTASATLDQEQGRVTEVLPTSLGDYLDQPTARISSGEGAVFSPNFDNYGRIVDVDVVNGGRYYKDVPSITAVDNTTKGKGALFNCDVVGGAITRINVINPGIDYSSAGTTIVATPVGSGAEIESVVEYYRFNRPKEIEYNSNWTFDSGNGFVYEKPQGTTKELFGYTCSPTNLRRDLDDNGSQHSPILGWAYDGNPIYGPFGYTNGVDNSEGVTRQQSGYISIGNRSTIIPSGGGNTVGSVIPSIIDYPMGIFVEDYIYDPFAASGTDPNPLPYDAEYITNEINEILETDVNGGPNVEGEYVTTDVNLSGNLGEDFEEARFIMSDPESGKDSEFITTEDDVIIETDVRRFVCFPDDFGPKLPNWVLDENNGKKCNTPEFPKELYPDGIFAYFITVSEDNLTPVFPYIIGKTFNNRPISQRINITSRETVSPLPRITSYTSLIYDETILEFDFRRVERFRNPNLTSTKTDLKLKVSKIAEGSVSGVLVIDGSPGNAKIGDLVFFDESKTTGAGVQAQVKLLEGENVINSFGTQILTRLISHRQRLDLSSNRNPDNSPKSFTFVPDSFIETFNTETLDTSIARVLSYNTSTMVLEIQTTTRRLVQNGDQFLDNKFNLVTTPVFDNTTFSQLNFNDENNVVIPSLVQPIVRPDSSDLKPGDLWWSYTNGRLYVYYNDNSSSQWVCTQPIGMIPMGDTASDVTIGVSVDDPSPLPSSTSENYVMISSSAPSLRVDGSPLQYGDLWWSSHTGVMYLWNVETYGNIPDPTNPGTAEWVCTDPSGTVPIEDTALDQIWSEATVITPVQYESGVKVIISETAPSATDVGGLCIPLEPGILWWSPVTGKMYIWYEEADGQQQWTITNPHGAINGAYSLDTIVGGGESGSDGSDDGDGDDIYGPNARLPETEDRRILWFDSLRHFLPNDIIEFETGAPGSDITTERAKIETLSLDDSALIVRGFEDPNRPGRLPDGTLTFNKTRSLYIFECDKPHELSIGDYIFVENSSFEEVNGEHEVVDTGRANLATGTASISNGQVVSVTVTDPGSGYPGNFYVTFSGGNGLNALALAEVDDLGSVTTVTMIQGGFNYSSEPNVLFAPQFSNTKFAIYTEKPYGEDNPNVRYTTSSNNVEAKPATIEVLANGLGYDQLPEVTGILKRSGDQAITRINLEGGVIESVDILNPGNRYRSPIAIFVDGEEGRGEGASAQVSVQEGLVTSIRITNGGVGYLDPTLYLVEDDGKYICDTEDIGRIQAVRVLNPGRNISADRSLKPELLIDTNCVVDYTEDSISSFQIGQRVYQGLTTNKLVTAVVDGYDDKKQMLKLVDVHGFLKEGEELKNDLGTKAVVVTNGQADCRTVINGTATPEGKFIDDTSMVSESYPVIQDSKRYQWFSYLISSPLQTVEYDTFVEKIIHPAGFVRFSDLTIHSSMRSGNRIIDDEAAIRSIIDECDPIVLLDSKGNPLIGSTQDGETVILAQDNCIERCPVQNLLANGSIPIEAGTRDGAKFIDVQDLCGVESNVLEFGSEDSNRFVLQFSGLGEVLVMELNI